MRSRFLLVLPVLGAGALLAVSALALHPSEKQPVARDAAVSAPEAAATTTVSPAADAAVAVMDAAAQSSSASTASNVNTFNLQLAQRGTGAMVHYPVPEQLQRNEVPVFAQVRTTAPIDHVSMFFRGHGGTRYREVRMTSVGANYGLSNGWGALIPCDDAFPPSVDYYVVAIDTSGAAIGSAGSATTPIELPIVLERTVDIVPTLPGEQPPKNCGAISINNFVAARDAGTRAADGGANVEDLTGTADLGEPCRKNDECKRGLRCGSNHQCVFAR